MTDNATSDSVEFEIRQLTDEEKAFELIEHLGELTRNREFLESVNGDHFRLKNRDDLTRSELFCLKSAFLIEEDESRTMGAVADWTTTRRCEWLLTVVPQDVNITEKEEEAYYTAGTDIFHLPPAGIEWELSDVHPDLAHRALGVLHDAGLIQPVTERVGHGNTWTATERLDEINGLLDGLAHA